MKTTRRLMSIVLSLLIVVLSVVDGQTLASSVMQASVNSEAMTQEQLTKLTQEGTYTYGTNGAFVCENSTGVYTVNEEGMLIKAERNYASTRAIVPYGVKKVASEVMSGLMIEELYLPPTMTSTGKYAFSECTRLKKVYFSEGLTEISVGAFCTCRSLEQVIFPESMTFVGRSAFEGCISLWGVCLNDGLQQVREDAFKDCDSLVSIYFPESVYRMDATVLAGCDKIQKVLLYNPSEYDQYTLAGMSYYGKKETIYVYGVKGSFAENDAATYNYVFVEMTPEIIQEMRKMPVPPTPTPAPVTPVPATAVPTTPAQTPIAAENKVILYYDNSTWQQVYVHYKIGDHQWLEKEDIQMQASDEMEGYQWKCELLLGDSDTATLCFHNGAGEWDSVNGNNYVVGTGIYGVKSYQSYNLAGVATKSPYATPAVTKVPTATPVVTKVPTATPVVTKLPTATPVVTKLPTATPVVTKLPTATPVVTKVPTATPVVTKIPTSVPVTSQPTQKPQNNILNLYYQNTNWGNANIHYKIGNGSWTQVPGVRMTATSEVGGYRWKYTINMNGADSVTVCFNDGYGNWDSNYGQNYVINVDGAYGITGGRIYELVNVPTNKPVITSSPKVTVTPVPTVTPKENTIIVYYSNSSWQKVNIHYKPQNKGWTTVPGVSMTKSTEQKGYEWKYTIKLGNDTQAQVCFNNGNGQWDSQNAANYWLKSGVYGIKGGKIYELRVSETPVPTPMITNQPTQTPVVTVKPTVVPTQTPVVTKAPTATPVVTKVPTATPVVTKVPTATPVITSTPQVTEKPNKQVATVYYGNTQWKQAYVHYKVNGKWTAIPGVKMSVSNEIAGYQWKYDIPLNGSKSAMICFTDGNGQWDSVYGNNYMVYAGVTAIQKQKCTVLTGGNYVTVHYNNPNWNEAYVHFKKGDGSWTSIPGKKMQKSQDGTGYTWTYTIALDREENVTLCFTNGKGLWDSKNGQNYFVEQCSTVGISNNRITYLP